MKKNKNHLKEEERTEEDKKLEFLPLSENLEEKESKDKHLSFFENAKESFKKAFSFIIFGNSEVPFKRIIGIIGTIVVWNIFEAIPVTIAMGQLNLLNGLSSRLLTHYLLNSSWNYKIKFSISKFLCIVYPLALGFLEEVYRQNASSKSLTFKIIKYSIIFYISISFLEYYLTGSIALLLLRYNNPNFVCYDLLIKTFHKPFNIPIYQLGEKGIELANYIFYLNLINRFKVLSLTLLCIPLNKTADLHLGFFTDYLKTQDCNKSFKNQSVHFIKGSLNSFSRVLGRIFLFTYLIFAVLLKIDNPLFMVFLKQTLSLSYISFSIFVFLISQMVFYYVTIKSYDLSNEQYDVKEEDFYLNRESLVKSYYFVVKSQVLSLFNFFRSLYYKDIRAREAATYGLLTIILSYHVLFKFSTDYVVFSKIIKTTVDLNNPAITLSQIFNEKMFFSTLGSLGCNALAVLISSLICTLIGMCWSYFKLDSNLLSIIYTLTYSSILVAIPILSLTSISPILLSTIWVTANLGIRISQVKFYYKKNLSKELSERSNLGNMSVTIISSLALYLFEWFPSKNTQLYLSVGFLGLLLNLIVIYLNQTSKQISRHKIEDKLNVY